MGWNDHMDDDDELGNLPPEAFGSWHVDGEFEPEDQWLRTRVRITRSSQSVRGF